MILINGVAIYRIIVDVARDFPKQYSDAGLVSGLSRIQIARYIQAPLIVRQALPRWIDLQVVILQTSVFASLISVDEIFRTAQRINAVTYEPVIIYTAMTLVFIITAGPALLLAKDLRERSYRDFSER